MAPACAVVLWPPHTNKSKSGLPMHHLFWASATAVQNSGSLLVE